MSWGDGVALVSFIIGTGGVAAWLQARSINRRTEAEARKTDAEATVTLGGGWQELVGQYRIELNELRERVVTLDLRATQSEEREAICQERLARIESGEPPAALERRLADLVHAEIQRRTEGV